MYKVEVSEERKDYSRTAEEPGANPATKWERTFYVESGEKEVVAGALRALANKLDPRKPETRGGDY